MSVSRISGPRRAPRAWPPRPRARRAPWRASRAAVVTAATSAAESSEPRAAAARVASGARSSRRGGDRRGGGRDRDGRSRRGASSRAVGVRPVGAVAIARGCGRGGARAVVAARAAVVVAATATPIVTARAAVAVTIAVAIVARRRGGKRLRFGRLALGGRATERAPGRGHDPGRLAPMPSTPRLPGLRISKSRSWRPTPNSSRAAFSASSTDLPVNSW